MNINTNILIEFNFMTISNNNINNLFCVFILCNTITAILDKEKLLTMLKYFFDLHWSITQIVCIINDLFKFRLFLFVLCGLINLMITPYVLSLTILNYNDKNILYHIIECAIWSIILISRILLMIYPCALLGNEVNAFLND